MTEHTPPTPPADLPSPEHMPLVRDQADLHHHWQLLMGELGFTRPSLWMHLLDAEGRSTPAITQIEDIPEHPDEQTLANLLWVCAELVRTRVPDGQVAFCRTRPGSRHLTAADRAWAGGLLATARSAHVACLPVHLANDEEIRVLPADDLDPPGSAA